MAREVKEAVSDDVRKVKAVFAAIGRGGLVATILGLHVVASVLVWVAMYRASVPYVFMYPLMAGVLLGFLVMRFTTRHAGRRVASGFSLVFNLALLGFWIVVLYDRMAPLRRTPGVVTVKGLWLPIVLYLLCGLLLLMETVFWRRRRVRRSDRCRTGFADQSSGQRQ